MPLRPNRAAPQVAVMALLFAGSCSVRQNLASGQLIQGEGASLPNDVYQMAVFASKFERPGVVRKDRTT